jgi:AcrR family transcriptional regulator
MDDHGAAPANDPNADAPKRDELLRAMLSLTGELGYRRATTELIAARAGVPVGYLYSQFSGREECFAAAYEGRAEPLLVRMLKAGSEEEGFADGLRAALSELFTFATTEPEIARALLSEVYVAGGAAQAQHEQILRRLSRAVAGTRRGTQMSRHDPPPIAATFIVGGLEEVVRRRVGERKQDLLWEELPDLVAFAAP